MLMTFFRILDWTGWAYCKAGYVRGNRGRVEAATIELRDGVSLSLGLFFPVSDCVSRPFSPLPAYTVTDVWRQKLAAGPSVGVDPLRIPFGAYSPSAAAKLKFLTIHAKIEDNTVKLPNTVVPVMATFPGSPGSSLCRHFGADRCPTCG